MNLNKTFGRVATTLVAGAMLTALAMPAYATNYNPANGIKFSKTIDMTAAQGATVPNVTYGYAINPGKAVGATQTTPEIKAGIAGATITDKVTFASTDTIGENKKVAQSVTVKFDGVQFPTAGIYRYVITETDPATPVAGLATSEQDNTIYLDVYVTNGDNGREISYYQMVTSPDAPTGSAYDDEAKFTGDEDAYTTYTLTVTKNVEGDMADMTAKFSIDVDFTNLSNGTKVTVDGIASSEAVSNAVSVNKSLGDDEIMTITGVPADAVYSVVENLENKAGYTVTYTYDDSEAKNATTGTDEYTTVSNSNMSSADHDVVVINTKTASAPTGIVMNVAPYVLLVVVAAAGCFVFLRKRRED